MNPSAEAPGADIAEHPGPPPDRGAALVLLSGILFGTAGTASAIAAPGASNVSVGALRVIVGGLALLAALPRLGGSRARVRELWLRPPVLLMAAAAALYQVCFFAAVAAAGVALGTLVTVGSQPILAGLLGWAALGHRPAAAWAVATAIAVVGLLLLSGGAISASGDTVAIGLLLALVAGLCSGIYNVVTTRVLVGATKPMELTAATFTLASLLLLPGLLTQPLAWLGTSGGVLLALYLGAVTAALANSWLARGVERLGPGPASTLMLADPVTATVLGVVVLHETIAVSAAIGMALVLVGLALQAIAPRRVWPEAGAQPSATF